MVLPIPEILLIFIYLRRLIQILYLRMLTSLIARFVLAANGNSSF